MKKVLCLLLLPLLIMPAQGQLAVTWNGTVITGPVLIYHDEILVDAPNAVIGETTEGALICMSLLNGATARWHFPNSTTVTLALFGTADIHQIVETGSRDRARLSHPQQNLMLTDVDHNGLWTCRAGGNDGPETIPVGLYHRGGERGAVTSVDLSISDFQSDPPSFTLVGDTSGGPPTNYTWTRNGIEITENGSFSISLLLKGVGEKYRESVYTSRLMVTGRLVGVYQYSVINRAMEDIRNDSITIKAAMPPHVTTSLLSPTSVTISWTQPEFSIPVLEYTVSLTRATGTLCPSVEDNRPAVTTTGTAMSFTGLEEFSTYAVTVNAMFGHVVYAFDGSGFRSMEIAIPSVAPTAAPANVLFSKTSTSGNVTWDSIECSERNGPITGYTVEFQEQDGARIPGEVSGQSFSASGLIPYTVYSFRVAGVNINGTGTFSSTANFQTDEDIPGMVFNLNSRPLLSSVTLTWSAPQEPNGVIISYEVTYRVNNSTPVTTNTTDLSTIFTIPSLAPHRYVSDISVSAYTRIGQGEGAELEDVATLVEPPLVTNVQVEIVSAASVRVSWKSVAIPVSRYIVYYSQTSNGTRVAERFIIVPHPTNSTVVDGLGNDRIYIFQVVAIAELGGREITGQKSTITDMSLVLFTSTTGSAVESNAIHTRDIYITASATFASTAILLTVTLLILCCICRACTSGADSKDNSKRNSYNYRETLPATRDGSGSPEVPDVPAVRDTRMSDPNLYNMYDVPPLRTVNPLDTQTGISLETHPAFPTPIYHVHYATPKISAPASPRLPPRPIHDSVTTGSSSNNSDGLYQNNFS